MKESEYGKNKCEQHECEENKCEQHECEEIECEMMICEQRRCEPDKEMVLECRHNKMKVRVLLSLTILLLFSLITVFILGMWKPWHKEKTVIIEEPKGKVVITKTDASTGKVLPNAGIQILDEERNPILQAKTDSKGEVVFSRLPTGEYYFREYHVPKGYQMNQRLVRFEIQKDNEVVKCTMENQPKKQHSPPTSDPSPFWILVAFLLVSAFILIITGKKIFSKPK